MLSCLKRHLLLTRSAAAPVACALFVVPPLQPDLYQRLSGTSMAVPHVTGALARIWADFPNCRSDTVRASIEQTAQDLGPAGKDTMYGAGLLQAEAAYNWLSRQPCARDGFTEERGQKATWQESRDGKKQQQQQEKAPGSTPVAATTAAAPTATAKGPL